MDDFEETIDVFSTVRMLRRQRPLLINSKVVMFLLYFSFACVSSKRCQRWIEIDCGDLSNIFVSEGIHKYISYVLSLAATGDLPVFCVSQLYFTPI